MLRRSKDISRRLSVHLGRDEPTSKRLSDVAYASVLQALYSRRILMGAFVSQTALVRLLGVPIQPLRDTLRVLEAEGILTIHPRAGIEFRRADVELAMSTYQFWTILMQAAVRHFAASEEAAIVDRLREAFSELALRIKEGYCSKHLHSLHELETRSHAELFSSFRNPLIDSVLRRLDSYMTIVQLDVRITAPLALQRIREHLEILDACRDRDAARAEAAVPWLTTADAIPDPRALLIRTWVNGELRQEERTAELVHGPETLLAWCSRGITLQAGDIISTGSPRGSGHGMKPPRYLQSGDRVRVEIDPLGAIENRIVAGDIVPFDAVG